MSLYEFDFGDSGKAAAGLKI
ncbi:hypothetical protein SPHV1_2170062 [Novosphingobium sp. KN65.2]|nr:hypothetical protein SPHV1_2170062 [Novosphingobium sp. KN65.2]